MLCISGRSLDNEWTIYFLNYTGKGSQSFPEAGFLYMELVANDEDSKRESLFKGDATLGEKIEIPCGSNYLC